MLVYASIKKFLIYNIFSSIKLYFKVLKNRWSCTSLNMVGSAGSLLNLEVSLIIAYIIFTYFSWSIITVSHPLSGFNLTMSLLSQFFGWFISIYVTIC